MPHDEAELVAYIKAHPRATHREISAQFGISMSTVSRAKRRHGIRSVNPHTYDDTVRAMVVTCVRANPFTTMDEIASWFGGMSERSVSRIVQEYGVKRPRVAMSPETVARHRDALDMFDDGASYAEIMAKYKIGKSTLAAWLAKARRMRGPSTTDHHCERCEILVPEAATLCDDCKEELSKGQLCRNDLPLKRIIELIGVQPWTEQSCVLSDWPRGSSPRDWQS